MAKPPNHVDMTELSENVNLLRYIENEHAHLFCPSGVYRGILEWSIWTIPSRLSFSAYLLHVVIFRNSTAMQTTTHRASALAIVSIGAFLL